MDKLEYIPGDLVMTNGVPFGTSKNIVYRVAESDPSKTLLKFDDESVVKGTVRLENYEAKEFGDKGYLSGDCGAWIKDIAPIPLTPEILEKNGWEFYHGFYCSPPEKGAGICLSSQTGYVWNAHIAGHTLRSDINSVSDLQHLLFGLGINHKMEV